MRQLGATRFALALLFVAGLLPRLVPVLGGFDGLYGQDAYAYYLYAGELFAALARGQMPPPFWWPLGYPALLNAAFAVGGVSSAPAQAVTILCGAAAAPAAFLFAYEAASPAYKLAAGWVAGLICAVSGQLVQSSVVIMADAPALLWSVLGAWLLLRYARLRDLLILALAALAVGMAVWTRWQNLIYTGVWFVTLLYIQLQPKGTPAQRWLPVAVALAIVGSLVGVQLLLRSAPSAPLAGQAWLEGWSVANFLARSFDTVDGHLEYELPVALFYGQVFLHPAYLVFMLTPLFVLGGGELVGRFLSGERAAAILLLGWMGAMLLFLAGIPYENFRFGLGLFAPIAVVTGIGTGWLWHRWRNSRLRFALAVWVALALLVMIAWQPRVLAPVLQAKAREQAQVRWLEGSLPPGALLWTMGVDGAIKTYSDRRVENIWNRAESELRANPSAFLFVDVSNLQTQWRDRQPNLLYQALRDAGALEEQGEYEGWTLYRIQ